MKTVHIAHAVMDSDGSWKEPHLLEDHLIGVATLASTFASTFGSSEWAYLSGLWHDLGKYRPKFQDRIRKATGFDPDAHLEGGIGKASHSTAGALLAMDRFGLAGTVLAYVIASHHTGLYDWVGGLSSRLLKEESREELLESMSSGIPEAILSHGTFVPSLRSIPGGSNGFHLWVRMMFSCLVDSDFLDTEFYMDSTKSSQRTPTSTTSILLSSFNTYMSSKCGNAAKTTVNDIRASILLQCRAKSSDAPGAFSLTVPTGGGKTLSSMAFALEHAKKYSKSRVIYVIPYTSIIEQTSNIFREIFGSAVVEHHSNVESDKETTKSRLACENWDAPIVVTTNVQFFESLFSSKTSRCRKLHNIVNSVVVLDEAQLLPAEFLQPVLDVLSLLTKRYGVTVVFSTATQPALTTKNYFDSKNNIRGLDNIREIIEDPDALYKSLERVTVRLPADWNTRTSFADLAKELVSHESVLVVVNTRKDARDLWELLPEGTLHLSALMCGEHRSQTIAEIKRRLATGIPTRVVSTQLVEAGVDVDFPVVYRAYAGLDSIAQAAGRCNREGTLDKGEVVVFVPPNASPPGMLRKGADACLSVLHGHTGGIMQRSLFSRYFELLYRSCNLDEHGIGDLLKVDASTLGVNFRTASEKFRLIQDEDTRPLVVHYRGPGGTDNTVSELLKQMNSSGPNMNIRRRLQRYIVNVKQKEVLRLLAKGFITESQEDPGLYIQASYFLYHPILGAEPC